MSRSKAPPRIKGPYCERGGTRSRIRICDATGRRDLYYSSKKEALSAIKEAARELPPSTKGRSLGKRLVRTPSRKTGRPPTAATHRYYLKVAKALFR